MMAPFAPLTIPGKRDPLLKGVFLLPIGGLGLGCVIYDMDCNALGVTGLYCPLSLELKYNGLDSFDILIS